MKTVLSVDAAKNKSMIMLMNSDGEILIDLKEIKHNLEDFKKLKEEVAKINPENLTVFMESTGTYHLPVERYFKENELHDFLNDINNKIMKNKYIKYDYEFKPQNYYDKYIEFTEKNKKDIINKIMKNKYIKYDYEFKPQNYYDKYIEFTEKNKKDIINKILENDNILYLNEKEIAQGIVCPQDSLNKKAVNKLGNEYSIGDGVFVINTTEYALLNPTIEEKKVLKNYYTSKQLKKWKCNLENELYIIYANKYFVKNIEIYPNIKKHLDKYASIITSDNKPYGLHRARDERFFKGEKIISKRKCTEPTFTYSNNDCYVSQTYNIIKTERVNYKYLIGILNSNLIKFWLKNKGKMQGENYQLDKEPLTKIPIVIDLENQDSLEALVEKILVKPDNLDYLQEINNIVYKIYKLDNENIKTIEEEV